MCSFGLVEDQSCHCILNERSEPGTRRRGTSLKHFIFNTEIAGDKYTHPMTLRLDPEAGKHRAFEGET